MGNLLSDKDKNMKLYALHRMLTADLLFYYAIKVIFLTGFKGIPVKDIVIASLFIGVFKIFFQAPAAILVERIGAKKCLMVSDISRIIAVIFVMASSSITLLIVSSFFEAISLAVKEVSETTMLNFVIPDDQDKPTKIARIESKGLCNFYFVSAVASLLSGALYNSNPYIPMCLTILTIIIAVRVDFMFDDVHPNKRKLSFGKEVIEEYRMYFSDLRLGLKFVFKSRRLRSLMLFAGLMYGMTLVMNTYEINLLQNINITATFIGIIYASMQVISGISSKLHNKIHKKFRNKTLTVIGLSYVIAILVAAITAVINFNYGIVVAIIVIAYGVRYFVNGAYNVLIKKYIVNFTSYEMVNKVYSDYGITTGIGNVIIGSIGAIIASNFDIKYSMLIFGLIFTIFMILTLIYMKTRIGLKPEEYRKKDIDYNEYISLK